MAVRGKAMTDAEERRIVADYVQSGSYCEAARRNGIVETSARRVVKRRPDLMEEAREASGVVEQTMVEYLQTQRGRVTAIIDQYLGALAELDRFDKLTPVQLSTVIGTLIDKWAMLQSQQESGGQSGGVVILPEVDDDG